MKKESVYACCLVFILLCVGCGSSSNNDNRPTAPDAHITPSALNFGATKIGKSMSLELSITNQGLVALNISAIALGQNSSPEFAITGTATDMTLNAGETAEVEVTYTPKDEGQDGGTIVLDCNDASDPRITIPLSGTGTHDDPPVVTTYEGFGAVTQGAGSSPDGYDTYHVTSMNDSGPGTLRDALSQGNRHIVFDKSGTIVLQDDLNIPYSYITIDGASAPSPGITIVQPGNIGTTIEARSRIGAAHDIIIHHLRMDGEATDHSNRGDIWGLDGESAPVYNIIIDHVTAIASTDGVFDIWEEVHDVTLSWNFIMDTETACHLSTGDTSKIRRRISFHHNVFARNNERQIRLRHNNQLIDFVNNVIYGWGWMESGSAGLNIQNEAGETNPSLNVVNNLFHYVSGLEGTPDNAVVIGESGSAGDVYFDGNLLPAGEDDAISTSGPLEIPASAQITMQNANTLHTTVVPHVGTQFPTAQEQQLLLEIQTALY